MNRHIKSRAGFVRYLFQTVVPLPAFQPLTSGLTGDAPPLLTQAMQSASAGDFMVTLFNIAVSVGAILAVLRIAYAGFVYMTTDVVSQKSNAKEIIQNAVVGLLLLLALILILERINPDILKIDFDLDQTTTGTTGTGAGGNPFPTF